MDERLPRKLATILYADVADYSRLTGEDEDATHRRFSEYLDLVSNSIAKHQGKVVHYAGDAVLADFGTVTNALECATSIQNDLANRNQNLPDERKIQFRIGINLGEVIVDRDDIYGNDVNVAARLESLADAGGICISDAVRTAIGNKLPIAYEFMGEQSFKNIKAPVRAYQVRLHPQEQTRKASLEFQQLEPPKKPSIAVLPFANMNADPEQEYFSDGITEDIITALSKIKNLLVIARNSTFIYKGKAVDVRQISREQGVGYVLEGSVRKSGNHIRVTAQLIDATSSHHVWAERYDRKLEDIFAVQDDITKNVTVALQVTLTEGEQARVFAGGTNSLEAWEYVVRGKDLMERHVKECNFEARQLLEKALQSDPDYVSAITYLGWTHWEDARYEWGESRDSSLDRAFELGQAALESEADHSDGLALLGFCYLLRDDIEQALAMSEKAAAMAPNHAFIVAISAAVLRQAFRLEEAISRIQRAMRLSPIYPAWYLMILGSAHHLLGDHETAVATLREGVRREPDSILLKPWFLSALIESNAEDEARLVAADILRIEPGFSRESWARPFGLKDPSVATRLAKNLEKVGLPE